jgi:carbonic anhydrase
VREKENPKLQSLVRKLKRVALEGQSVHLDSTFTMASLLPEDLEVYYTYRGSLTTPPCSEVVTWIVFPEPQFISYRQVSNVGRRSHKPHLPHRNVFIFQMILKVVFDRITGVLDSARLLEL